MFVPDDGQRRQFVMWMDAVRDLASVRNLSLVMMYVGPLCCQAAALPAPSLFAAPARRLCSFFIDCIKYCMHPLMPSDRRQSRAHYAPHHAHERDTNAHQVEFPKPLGDPE